MFMLVQFCVIICSDTLFTNATKCMTEQMELWELPRLLLVSSSCLHTFVNKFKVKHLTWNQRLLDEVSQCQNVCVCSSVMISSPLVKIQLPSARLGLSM